ncbi:MAG: hypothetical protein ACRCZF_24730, partial [Gemmataceae bacterium]
AEVAEAFRATHDYPSAVTPAMRVAQLGIVGFISGFAFLLLFLLAFTFQLWASLIDTEQLEQSRAIVAMLERTETIPPEWDDDLFLKERLAPARRLASIESLRRRLPALESRVDKRSRSLVSPERMLIKFITEREERTDERIIQNRMLVRRLLEAADQHDPSQPLSLAPQNRIIRSASVVIAIVLAGFIVCSWLFRGGINFLLAGLTLVRRDGREARRWQCAVRELLTWVPFMALLLICIFVQATIPDSFLLRIGTIVLTILVALLAVIGTVRRPERTPVDRLLGLTVVPR